MPTVQTIVNVNIFFNTQAASEFLNDAPTPHTQRYDLFNQRCYFRIDLLNLPLQFLDCFRFGHGFSASGLSILTVGNKNAEQ